MSERHHHVQSWGLRLVCSGCCDADRQGCLCVERCGLVQGGKATAHCWWLTSEPGGRRAHICPLVSTLHKGQQGMLDLCAAVDAITVRGDPLGASSSRQTGTGRADRCGQSQHQDGGGSGEGGQPAGLNCPRHFLFAWSEGNTATSHLICGAVVIKRDSSDGLLGVTDAAVRPSV